MDLSVARDETGWRSPLNVGWLFGGPIALPLPEDWPDDPIAAAAAAPDLDDASWQSVNVPHTVVPLGWLNWDAASWEKVWQYRKHFDLPTEVAEALTNGERIFIDFEAVGAAGTVTLNGTRLGRHWGGYLPFSYEITDAVQPTGNVLAVLVDARFNLNVPPNMPSPAHSSDVDYHQPGGIYGTVTLRGVPHAYVASVNATPADVLDPAARRLDVTAVIDTGTGIEDGRLEVSVQDAAGETVAGASVQVDADTAGAHEVSLTVTGLESIQLWDVEDPNLYHVVTTFVSNAGTHTDRTRIGFREARFELDGFYLNGRRLYLFGANRHQHYPYAGFAMPARVQRKDAELLRNELNCVMVRCSHYPQFSAFLDACDELGLLVWEEAPGWQFIGDQLWQARATEDIASMILRDRNRPSVIIWGGRLNETPDNPELYTATEELVKRLDPTRATSGTMHSEYYHSPYFNQDVFAYDDYSIEVLEDGDYRPTLRPPRTDRPYMIGETVTSWSSPTRLYRRAEPAIVQQHQAMDYAYAHNIARGDNRYTGVLAWSGIDYQAGHVVNYRGMKTSGMSDIFRVLKPGAAMYRAQVEASVRPVLEAAFTWDPPVARQLAPGMDNRTLGSEWGPGEKAVVFTNCDRIEAWIGGEKRADAHPDHDGFPNLITPPTLLDLSMTTRDSADLVLRGFIGDALAIEKSFSGTLHDDRLTATADDPEIAADGVDATRVELAIVDKFGSARGHSEARVRFEILGPGVLIGEPEFDFHETGAVGAVWIRSSGHGEAGLITVRVGNEQYGNVGVTIQAVAP